MPRIVDTSGTAAWEIKENHLMELSKRINKNSPDYIDRKLEGYLPVFVYGTLKAGGRLHSILNGSPWLGEAHTVLSGFSMWEVPDGGFPLVYEVPKGHSELSMAGYIWGEVYVVDPVTLLELDRLENNMVMYQRSMHHVFLKDQSYKLSDGEKHNPALKCWVYCGIRDYWNGVPLTAVVPRYETIKGFSRKTYTWDKKAA